MWQRFSRSVRAEVPRACCGTLARWHATSPLAFCRTLTLASDRSSCAFPTHQGKPWLSKTVLMAPIDERRQTDTLLV